MIITEFPAPPDCLPHLLTEWINASATLTPSQQHAQPAIFFLTLSLRSSQLPCQLHPPIQTPPPRTCPLPLHPFPLLQALPKAHLRSKAILSHHGSCLSYCPLWLCCHYMHFNTSCQTIFYYSLIVSRALALTLGDCQLGIRPSQT